MKIFNLSYMYGPEISGHEVLHMSRPRLNDSQLAYDPNRSPDWGAMIAQARGFDPDIIIEREWNDGRALYVPIYAAFFDRPRVWWWIDAHCNWEKRKEYAKNFTHIFLAISRFVEPLKEYLGHDRVYWLPLCWDGPVILNTGSKDIEISFVCRWYPNHPDARFHQRAEIIRRLQERYGKRFVATTNFSDRDLLYRRSIVSINTCLDNDLNYRNFEVMANGSELVTQTTTDIYKVPGMADRCLIWTNYEELEAIIEAALAGDIKHDLVANQKWIEGSHLITHRYQSMINIVSGGSDHV